MALDYDGSNTGIFDRGGKAVKYVNSHSGDTATLDADLKAIADKFEAADMTRQISGLYDQIEQQKQGVTALRQLYAGVFDAILTDQDSVLDELRLTTNDVNAVLDALITRMNDDAESILNSTVTLGSVTAVSGNTGNGWPLIYNVLDGYNAPLGNGFTHPDYAGVPTELCVTSETMTFTCIQDSDRDGGTEGGEQFAWQGQQNWPPFDPQAEGSGDGPNLNVISETASIISNGTFESFSSNAPASWTIDNGTAGTHIFANSTAAHIHRGTYSLRFHGTGAAATIGIHQNVSSMNAKRAYCVPVWIKTSAVPAAGAIAIQFKGTGYTAASPTPEVQTFQISGTPTGGNYTLSWVGPIGGTQTTANIAYNATSATVQAALRLLTGLESVVVTTSAGSPPDVTHSITFHGTDGNIAQLTSNITGLTGGSPAKAHATTTPGVRGEKIALPKEAFPTTMALYWFWIQPPVVIPSDWNLAVEVTGTLSNNVEVYFDDLTPAEVVYHGGIGAVIVAGSTQFGHGDRFTLTVANDDASKFQSFYRQWYGVQLPSNSSPTISNSLAT